MSTCNDSGWCQKLTAIILVVIHFIILIFINNSSYIWATLALVFILIISTFICTSNRSRHLLRFRGAGETRPNRTQITARVEQDGNNAVSQENTTGPTQQTMIWTTDIPPSYSYVMGAGVPPQTPPPSYGSAILLFPPPYPAETSKAEPSEAEDSANASSPSEASQPPRRFRPLSISTQVSVCSLPSSTPQTPQIGAAISYQIISLVNGVSDAFSDTVSLRTQLFLSRQVSREELPNGGEQEDGSRPNNAIELHSCQIPIFFVPDNESVNNESVVIPITSEEETRSNGSKE